MKIQIRSDLVIESKCYQANGTNICGVVVTQTCEDTEFYLRFTTEENLNLFVESLLLVSKNAYWSQGV